MFRAVVPDKTGHLAFLDLKSVLFWEVEEQKDYSLSERAQICSWQKIHMQTCLIDYTVIKQNTWYTILTFLQPILHNLTYLSFLSFIFVSSFVTGIDLIREINKG